MKTTLVALAASFAATASPAQIAGAELAPQFRWKPLPEIRWKTHGGARIERGVMTVSLDVPGTAYAEAELDLSEYDGKAFEIAAIVETKDVRDAQVSHGGFSFCTSYLDIEMGGNRTWPHSPKLPSDFGPSETIFTDRSDKVRGKPILQIGLFRARGVVRCDLSTLRIREPPPLVALRNQGRIVTYPDRISKMPPMRGVSIAKMNGDAWDNLESWGARLVRYHMDMPRQSTATNYEAYAESYRAAAERHFENVARILDEAHAHGMKVILVGHSAGGDCKASAGDPPAWNRDKRMFHDKRYADLFVWFWERIAERFAKRTEDIYGYDLMNEPRHLSPAIEGGDLVSLMERTARAIRKIDPDTPIVVESMHGDPDWFRSLSALDLDNVIYSVHSYNPHDFTHQAIYEENAPEYKWPDESRGWNREFIRRRLQPVIDFQREHRARILVGEFSAVAWADGAGDYLRDSISLFEELGWDWVYHEYREYRGWNVEIETEGRGRNARVFPSQDNPRKRALLDGLSKGNPIDPPGMAAEENENTPGAADARKGILPSRADATSSVDWSSAMLVGSLNRDCPFFAPGEEMVFTITLEGVVGDIPRDTYFVDWERRGDDGLTKSGRAPLPAPGAPLVLRTKSDRPGFIRISANVVTADGKRVRKEHPWEPRVFFQGGAAVAPETLGPGSEPTDYDKFWDEQMARLDAVPVQAELTPVPCKDTGVRLYAVRIVCAGPRPVTGWLTVPADASATNRYPVEVRWRGASREDQPAPSKGPHDRIQFESNGHGFELGRGAEYVAEFFRNVENPGFSYGFDPKSNEHRETSYWLGMILRAVRAVQWAETIPEWDGKNLFLGGGSQGGWNALHAASHCPRVSKCNVSIVWGCDWTGQAEFGRMESGYRPKCWFADMAYFDPVFAARRIRCPVRIGGARLGDYVSPPSSLAVLYNVLSVPKQIVWRQGWTHGWNPEGMASFFVDDGYDAATSTPGGK